MVEGAGEFESAADAATLLRAYALRLAAEPDAAPHAYGAFRDKYRQARAALPRPPAEGAAAGAADLATPAGWLDAFVQGATTRADLADALASLEARGAPRTYHLRKILAAYPTWVRARSDRRVPKELLRRVVREMRQVGGVPPAPVDGDLRRAALRARRIHPELLALAPLAFEELLAPRYRAAEVRMAHPPRSRSKPARLRSSDRRSQQTAWPLWAVVFFAVAASSLVRNCTTRTSQRTDSMRSLQERLRENRKRLDERFPDRPWRREGGFPGGSPGVPGGAGGAGGSRGEGR